MKGGPASPARIGPCAHLPLRSEEGFAAVGKRVRLRHRLSG